MLIWMLSLEFPGTGEQTVEPETVGHLLGNVITKAGCVMGVLHRTHNHNTRASTQGRTGENVCNRLDSSSKRGKGTKESN